MPATWSFYSQRQFNKINPVFHLSVENHTVEHISYHTSAPTSGNCLPATSQIMDVCVRMETTTKI